MKFWRQILARSASEGERVNLYRPRLRYGLVCLTLLAIGGLTNAQDETEENPYRPGLVATYSAGGISATRLDEAIAFDWQDAVPDPRLPAGEFAAIWRGRLWAQAQGTYQLLCFAQGAVEVKLGGRVVVSGQANKPQWIRSQALVLPFDRHELEVTYRKTGPRGQLALFWTGPEFRLEPIAERFLMHDRERSPSAEFERGRQLATALRCAACHRDEATSVTSAPALDRLAGNVHEAWLVDWLSSHVAPDAKQPLRRMPDLGITRDEATAIAAWLLREPAIKKEVKLPEDGMTKAKPKSGKKKAEEEPPRPTAAAGERLLLTRGCLACHQYGELGESGLFGGGDLTKLAEKRPADFLVRWVSDPAVINRSHRMPQFTFTPDELKSLDLWWKQSGGKSAAAATSQRVNEGEKLIATFRCASCHIVKRDDAKLAAAALTSLSATSNWSQSCSAAGDRSKVRPGYRLAADDQAALKTYYSQSRPGERSLSPQARGRDLLVQLNCLACHQREGIDRSVVGTLRVPSPGIDGDSDNDGTRRVPATLPSLQERLVAVAEAHGDLAPLVPAMTPPALNGVGDKLQDGALADSIRRKGPPHRPYLLVQMPTFALTDAQLADLTAYFTATDRIPSGAGLQPATAGETPAPRLAAAGPRLVTADGLSCTSCHQIGSVQPAKAPLNARGPDISMLEKRIRREWFDRWCDNPARIVPRMEMPAVKVPVRGVLNDKVADQLAAVWQILNTPGFEPPEPNPVRVLRLSGVPERNERPIVIHDVVKDGDKTYLFPLIIGLPNRHNILFDLETNRLAAWWIGDTARQRTKGKSWHWEMGAKSIFDAGLRNSEISLWIDGKERLPIVEGQFASELLAWSVTGGVPGESMHPPRVDIVTRMRFPTTDIVANNAGPIATVETFESYLPCIEHDGLRTGVRRMVQAVGDGQMNRVRFRLVSPERARECQWEPKSQTLTIGGKDGITIRVFLPKKFTWNNDGSMLVTESSDEVSIDEDGIRNRANLGNKPRWQISLWIDYLTNLPVDQYVASVPPLPPMEAATLKIAPGLSARRLPLDGDLMPSAITWNSKGELVLGTLKGQVERVVDRNGDGEEDAANIIADGLAAPYGIQAFGEHVDVLSKDALLRLDIGDDGVANLFETIAAGWGYTNDYHDWSVGLIKGDAGEYYAALPCQQDARSDAAAKLRGKFLKLVPRKATPDNPRLFDIEIVSAGHRFPMGMARNRDGEIFVTDNQGNYNPFNELNHVRKGAHFGFINALEKEQGFKPPPLSEPAIDIPHPWTRSVNGICFLETPVEQASPLVPDSKQAGTLALRGREPAKSIFGPLEGQLVGCEYDTRRLIRMSLQRVGDTYQGAAYPLSQPPADVEQGLLGPIVCAVKPTTGELYVGEIRDSGWGAGNNIGQIVKIKIEPDKLPCGIAEVRATANGFTIDFLQPADRAKAADAANYSLDSYRRESTPAYGGSDIDRRIEKISAAVVSPDGKRVTLTLPQLRAGFVYELKLKNLAPGGGVFFPDEAHYTLRKIP